LKFDPGRPPPKILVVEDDDFAGGLIGRMLAPALVSRARDGIEGLHLFGAGRFDLVITDLIMPRRDGLSTIADIRRLDSSVPIIAMSGGGSIGAKGDLLKLARTMGADATLPKPFERDALMAVVLGCLAGR
jgi:DNA-binding response OmpR family regulator